LDIVVVLGKEASEVLENLDLLEYIPVYRGRYNGEQALK
jgi:hypothetical protein